MSVSSFGCLPSRYPFFCVLFVLLRSCVQQSVRSAAQSTQQRTESNIMSTVTECREQVAVCIII